MNAQTVYRLEAFGERYRPRKTEFDDELQRVERPEKLSRVDPDSIRSVPECGSAGEMDRLAAGNIRMMNLRADGRSFAMALFSEKEIRPPNVLVGQQIAIRQDIGFLLSRYDQFVKTACPACRGVTTKPHLAKHGFTYDLCNSCGTVFMNPRAPEAVLADFYRASANYAYWNKYIFPASATVRRERIFRPRWRNH